METNEIKYLIAQYYDGELDAGQEAALFNSLAGNENLRKYFKASGLLKLAVAEDTKPFPAELDKKILYAASEQKTVKLNGPDYAKIIGRILPYAAAIVLFILALVYSRKSESYESQVIKLTSQVENQNNKIELLLHALPSIEVTPNYKQTSQIY